MIKTLLNWTIIPILKLIFIFPAVFIALWAILAGRDDIGDLVIDTIMEFNL